ncbi:hypothetical protein LX16_2613 [Stackebrandtia albiflava]|uniref:Uncharacterized protein n=1 Tax=Stackebrandtia albiflava TaxID=406432 RepID=A0A562V209_9ACTN|nr:hypothetical protein [Stackebrandtia albiflava]TWJ11875.1 hypothetical protein LX16_2613 [Stackebrandtia albiflava]
MTATTTPTVTCPACRTARRDDCAICGGRGWVAFRDLVHDRVSTPGHGVTVRP